MTMLFMVEHQKLSTTTLFKLEKGIGGSINMRELMQFVKDKHTYVNRINNILKFYDRIQSPRYRWSFGKPKMFQYNSQRYCG